MWRAPSWASSVWKRVAGVGLVVVGHDRLDRPAALLGHPAAARRSVAAAAAAVVGAVQLAVGQAAVVIDDASAT